MIDSENIPPQPPLDEAPSESAADRPPDPDDNVVDADEED